MDAHIKELVRIKKTINMMLTMHSVLRDKYKNWSCILDMLLLIGSLLLLISSFIDPTFLKSLKITPESTIIVSKISSIVIFVISLILLRVDWRGRAERHSGACTELGRLKGETQSVIVDSELDQEKVQRLQQLYTITMGGIAPIPEKYFHGLKNKHLKKVELSKMQSRYPGTSLWQLRIRLVIEGFRGGCTREKDFDEKENKDNGGTVEGKESGV